LKPLEGAQKSSQNTKIHKILLSCGLVIHVKARILKAKTKASNPRPGCRPRPDTDKAKDKKFGLKVKAKD